MRRDSFEILQQDFLTLVFLRSQGGTNSYKHNHRGRKLLTATSPSQESSTVLTLAAGNDTTNQEVGHIYTWISLPPPMTSLDSEERILWSMLT